MYTLGVSWTRWPPPTITFGYGPGAHFLCRPARTRLALMQTKMPSPNDPTSEIGWYASAWTARRRGDRSADP